MFLARDWLASDAIVTRVEEDRYWIWRQTPPKVTARSRRPPRSTPLHGAFSVLARRYSASRS